MSQQGDTFSFKAEEASNEVVSFDILISDLIYKGAGHIDPKYLRWSYSINDSAYIWTGPAGSDFENNFGFEDGSVKKYILEWTNPSYSSPEQNKMYKETVATPNWNSQNRLHFPREFIVQ